MKSFEEFTLVDLHDFIAKHNITKKDERGCKDDSLSDNLVIDYEHLSNLLSCKERNARAIVGGDTSIKRHHYDLLAFHTKTKQPQLV